MGAALVWWLGTCVLITIRAEADIRRPPKIHEFLPKEDIFMYREGGNVTVKCEATGSPPPSYTLLKDSKPIGRPFDGVHIISVPSDEGHYQCKAHNPYGTSISRTVFLQRAVFVPSGRDAVTVLEREEGSFLMIPRRDHFRSVQTPSYKWWLVDDLKDDHGEEVVLNDRVQQDEDGNLYFSHVTVTDSLMMSENRQRIYKCDVRNSYTDVTSGGSYTKINVAKKDGLMEHRKPTLRYSTANKTVIEGEQVRLQCIFSAYPDVKVSWSSTPERLGTSNDEVGPVLDVTQARDATYTCTGTNDSGTARAQITITTAKRPTLISEPVDQNVTEGEDAVFTCTAKGRPPPTVNWLINGNTLHSSSQQDGRTVIGQDNTTLTVHNVCRDCPGETTDLKVIQCNASNAYGYVLAEGYLNVLSATKITPLNQDIVLGNETRVERFDCHVTHDPSTPVTVTWSKDKEMIKGDKRLIMNGTSLIIDLTNVGDASAYLGAYTCHADNGYSHDTQVAHLVLTDQSAARYGSELISAESWLVLVILLVLGLLIVITLIMAVYFVRTYRKRKHRATYPVSRKEKKDGLDPLKELVAAGFQETTATAGGSSGSGTESMNGSSVMVIPEDRSFSGQDGSFHGGLAGPRPSGQDGSFHGGLAGPRPAVRGSRMVYNFD